MLTRSVALALLATVMIGGAAVNRAQAMVAGPATVAPESRGDENVIQVKWVCGDSRCDWQPWNVFHPGHDFARSWPQPRAVGCYREKHRGRWREVCPH